MELTGFQAWLYTRRAHDNPRGDLIRDFKAEVKKGRVAVDPNGETAGFGWCYEALRELRGLKYEWECAECPYETIEVAGKLPV